MNPHSKPETQSPPSRTALPRIGKIARLPFRVRQQLNRRLRDGESGPSLLEWLNSLPEVKAPLKRYFEGRPINHQNLSDWKNGGHRDWIATEEAADWLADTLSDLAPPKPKSAPKRDKSSSEPAQVESVADRVAGWFFPHYVAAARGELTAARTRSQRWSVLRMICADLGNFRRNEHYVQRLRIWREKLQVETVDQRTITEGKFLAWVKKHPDVKAKLWPPVKKLTPKEKEARVKQILGLD